MKEAQDLTESSCFPDIDECTAGHGCDVNADCVNVGGGYRCDCGEGFKQEKLGDPLTGQCIGDLYSPIDVATLRVGFQP